MAQKEQKKNWEELKLNVAVAEVQLSSQFVKNHPQLGRGEGVGGTLPNVLADDTSPGLFLQCFIKYLTADTHLEAPRSPSRFVNHHLGRGGGHCDEGGGGGRGGQRWLSSRVVC